LPSPCSLSTWSVAIPDETSSIHTATPTPADDEDRRRRRRIPHLSRLTYRLAACQTRHHHVTAAVNRFMVGPRGFAACPTLPQFMVGPRGFAACPTLPRIPGVSPQLATRDASYGAGSIVSDSPALDNRSGRMTRGTAHTSSCGMLMRPSATPRGTGIC
jgi:hypothetical protein